jgi:hypothetical protein
VSESDSDFNITSTALLRSPRTWEKLHKAAFSVDMIFVQLEKIIMSTGGFAISLEVFLFGYVD